MSNDRRAEASPSHQPSAFPDIIDSPVDRHRARESKVLYAAWVGCIFVACIPLLEASDFLTTAIATSPILPSIPQLTPLFTWQSFFTLLGAGMAVQLASGIGYRVVIPAMVPYGEDTPYPGSFQVAGYLLMGAAFISMGIVVLYLDSASIIHQYVGGFGVFGTVAGAGIICLRIKNEAQRQQLTVKER